MNNQYKNCFFCKIDFNQLLNEPKILPCSHLICRNCLNISTKFLREIKVKCSICYQKHILTHIDDLPTSNIIKDFLEIESNDIRIKDTTFLNQNIIKFLEYGIRRNRLDINEHYDSVINDIDIRAENVIKLIHLYRQSLQLEIKRDRENSLQSLDIFESLKMRMTNDFDKNAIINDYNKIQSTIYLIKKNFTYFLDNSIKLDKSLLGYNLGITTHKNILKIQNINNILANEINFKKITLSTIINKYSKYDKIIPLSPNKIIKLFYDSTYRSFYLELFDSEGIKIKSITPFVNVNHNPKCYGYGNHFLVSFVSSCCETLKTSVYLFDSNLNITSACRFKSSIESIYMTERYITLTFFYLRGCCWLFDYSFNKLQEFGQCYDENDNFFIKRYEYDFGCHNNNYTEIFGLNDNYIYLSNYKKMLVLDKDKGNVLHDKKNSNNGRYLLDSQSNIIIFSNSGKISKLTIIDIFNDIEVTNDLNTDSFDNFYVTKNNLAFINSNKNEIIFF